MLAAPYVPPPVKHRLTKPHTTNHYNTNFSTPARISRSFSSLSCSLLDNTSTEQLPVRTSYTALKHRAEARRELRSQLSSTLPETRGEVSAEIGRGDSLDSWSGDSMGMYDRFKSGPMPALAQNEGALSSSSTVDSVGQVVKMLGQENTTIDVEAAINLLQELKKNASPEELVALHRALLPTKDVETVSSPVKEGFGDRPAFFNQSSTRRSSRLPPGLATRGGTDEDLLRRQGDQPTRQKRASMQFEQTPSPRERKFSGTSARPTLQEAPDETPPTELTRAHTPSEEPYGHMGGYKHGSLRITNGAASPEPGRLIRPHLEHSESEPIFHEPQRKASLDFHPGRPAVDRAATQSVRQRILHSAREPKQSPAWTRRSSRTPGTQEVTSKMLTQPYTPLQLSTNHIEKDEGVSPVSAPPSISRDAQRFSRRESAVSLASPSDGEQVPTPRAAPTMIDFASRLSTVFGEDQEPDSRSGTPEDALAKLTGEADKRPEMRRRSTSAKPRYYPSIDVIPDGERPLKVKHMDSGYGSDERRLSGAAPSPREIIQPMETKRLVRDSFMNVAQQSEADDNADGKSMYTFNEFLTSPAASQPTSPTAPQLNSKKSRFLALRSKSFTNKRNSAPVSPSYAPQLLNDSVQTIDSTASSPAGAERTSRQPRKLQKTHPTELKKSRSLRKAVLKEATSVDVLPVVPQQVNDTWAKRLESEPGSSHVDQTYQQAEAAESQDDLTPLPTEKSDTISATVAETQHKPPTEQKRSFSRGRKAVTYAGSSTEDLSDVKKSNSIFRKRSKSRSRSSKRPEETDEELTTTDFSPITDSLGSGPYDLSTNQFDRKPSSGKPGVQSPWQISTGLLKSSKTGMNEEMASELARKKSRDVAMRNAESHEERARMATPKKGKKERATVKPPVPQTSNRSVEDFYPDWTSKAAGTPPQQTVPTRAFSMYAESVPPLPDLPLDVAAKAAKAEVMVAKKMRNSPAGSARQSLEPTPSPKPSKAKTSVDAKREQVRQLEDEKKANEESLHLLHPAVRPRSTDADVNVAVREVGGSGSDTESKDSRPTSSNSRREEPAVEPPSPSHDATHPGWPGWEQQAKLWRDRRLAATLPHNAEEDEPTDDTPTPVQSPSIVVSRYITPMGSDTAARAAAINNSQDPTSAASQHADLYRDLIDNKENRPAKQDLPRTDSATSNNTFVTVQTHQSDNPRPVRHDLPRADSAFSAKTWNSTTSTTTSTSTTRHPRTRPPPQPCQPSHDRDALASEDRHQTAYSSYRSDDTRARAPRERSQPRPTYDTRSNTTTTTTHSAPSRPPLRSNPSGSNASANPIVDRYSGGLQYEWHRQGGFGGSAGTRLSGEGGAPRKGLAMAEQWGVDLGDVPVFLQRRGWGDGGAI